MSLYFALLSLNPSRSLVRSTFTQLQQFKFVRYANCFDSNAPFNAGFVLTSALNLTPDTEAESWLTGLGSDRQCLELFDRRFVLGHESLSHRLTPI